MKLNSYVNVNNIIIYIYKLKIILFNFMDKIYEKIIIKKKKTNFIIIYKLWGNSSYLFILYLFI